MCRFSRLAWDFLESSVESPRNATTNSLYVSMRASAHTSTSSVSACRPLARAFRRSAANSASHIPHRRNVVAPAQTPATPTSTLTTPTTGFSAFDRVSILSEALPYLQRFRGKTVVVRTRRSRRSRRRRLPGSSLARSLARVCRNSPCSLRFLPRFLLPSFPFTYCR